MSKKMAWLKLFRIEREKCAAKCVRTISVPPVMVTAFAATPAYIINTPDEIKLILSCIFHFSSTINDMQ
jgi:hypothetical protein